jgi:hypothetical protein
MERCISLQNCMAGWYVYLNVLQVAFMKKGSCLSEAKTVLQYVLKEQPI